MVKLLNAMDITPEQAQKGREFAWKVDTKTGRLPIILSAEVDEWLRRRSITKEKADDLIRRLNTPKQT